MTIRDSSLLFWATLYIEIPGGITEIAIHAIIRIAFILCKIYGVYLIGTFVEVWESGPQQKFGQGGPVVHISVKYPQAL